MSLADKIEVNTRYTRSTNVERDRGSRSIIDAYLPTACGTSLLGDIAESLRSDWPTAGMEPYRTVRIGQVFFCAISSRATRQRGRGEGRRPPGTLATGRPDLARAVCPPTTLVPRCFDG